MPVTVIEAGPCVVTQLRSQDKDGYEAAQLGLVDAKAAKKAGRTAAEGVIVIKHGDAGAAMVEVNCETDFVAKDDNFQTFADAVTEAVVSLSKGRGDLLLALCLVVAGGFSAFLNNTPIRWISKCQKTVETSTYGSELVAARIAIDLIIEMVHNLRSLGVPIDGPALLLGDNQSVVLNTTVPSSVLKKKHNAVAFHCICKAIAARICRFVHIPCNLSITIDLFRCTFAGPSHLPERPHYT